MTQAIAAVPIRRPTFREGERLEVAELQAEQQSRDGALARHERNVHTPGIVTGLHVTPVTVGAAGVQVTPGLAVDGTRRYLLLKRPLTASLADGEDVTVSIVWREGDTQIELSDTPPPAQADRTQDAWPVVLGRAARSAGTVTVDAGVREELQLRATALSAPAGVSRVVLGGQSGHRTRVLGVQLASGGGFDEVTTVNADGTSRVGANVSVEAEVRAAGAVTLTTPVPALPTATPWSLYRATLTRPDKTVAEQLRLEVGEAKAGADPHALELLVTQGGTGTAADLLHVDAGGTVTIAGDLVVEGFTTMTGQPSALPNAPTLTSLAAQEADLLAQAQILLNQLTDTNLLATQLPGPPPPPNAVSYTLRLSSVAMAVTAVAAYETVIDLAGNTPISSQFVAQGIDLPAGSTNDTVRQINVGAAGQTISVVVLAIGVGQDGQPRTGTLRFQAST